MSQPFTQTGFKRAVEPAKKPVKRPASPTKKKLTEYEQLNEKIPYYMREKVNAVIDAQVKIAVEQHMEAFKAEIERELEDQANQNDHHISYYMMKGVPPTDARPPPKIKASLEMPAGVNPYWHYGHNPWAAGYPHPYVPYGRRSTKRMSMAALPPYPPAFAAQEEEVSVISSEQDAAEAQASKVSTQKSQGQKKTVHRPSTAIAPGVYPYRYMSSPSMGSKQSAKRLSKLPTEKWNGFTAQNEKAEVQKNADQSKQERRKQYGDHIKRLSTRVVPDTEKLLQKTTIGKQNTFKSK